MTISNRVKKSIIRAHTEEILQEFGRMWNAQQVEELVELVSTATYFKTDTKPLIQKLEDEIWFAMRTLERKWTA